MARHRSVTTQRKFIFYLVLAALLFTPLNVHAASGLPDSLKFGYGARLDPQGKDTDLAIAASASIGLDWIGVDFNWKRSWPIPEGTPDLAALDRLAQAAHKNDLHLLLSITNPPAWALNSQGPDPAITARLVEMLARRYQGTLLAIEPFPEANTAAGWGAAPQPGAYAALLAASWETLGKMGSPVTLVAGGLRNLPAGHGGQDMDDLSFLRALYESGARNLMPVVSLHLAGLSGAAISAPASNSAALRRYELVREVMLQNKHAQGRIWITSFNWPPADGLTMDEQSDWVAQAYQLMRSQLYIGSAFFDQLNPSNQAGSIIYTEDQETHIHPALLSLAQLITLDRSGQWIPIPPGSQRSTLKAGTP